MMNNKKNMQTENNEGFAVLAQQEALSEIMAEDCQGLEFSFDRVKLPAGGGTTFEIPSAESEEGEMVKAITGVIVMPIIGTSMQAGTIRSTAALLTARRA